ncbi:SusF/SusE family outer membrane protein [Microbacter margulisiae]|uniref:SusE outer membrane protein domain-containing protein n=1 Tax=Microbacter margulisiae TaxID=1350067 RepID=A0A7W5DSA4_9PORP|nr:SusF/SusE family outer membrane protein [Microbacter margulisiae]MBB3188140.1 hypothetical protein [Microbacter margulisiae]
MNKNNIMRITMQYALFNRLFSSCLGVLAIALIFTLSSCQDSLFGNIAVAGPLALSTSSDTLVLAQKNDQTTALTLSWTTGTNHGTGASIAYVLQIDKKGNNFASAIQFNMGKGVYTKSFTVAELNDSLLNHWKFQPGIAAQLEARIIDTVYSQPIVNDVSPLLTMNVTPYQPVSKTLYLVGSASPNGADVNNAIVMTPSATDPTIFTYQGLLNAGSLKFITTLGQVLPSYNEGADSTHLIYRTDSSQPDNQFTVSQSAVYKVTVSLLDLTVSIKQVDLPPYSTLYIVGDAAPNGWDIANATPLVEDPNNPFVFTYQGVLNAGAFKFPVNRNTDWNQDMYMRTDDTHMYLHKGGNSDDNKWTIAKKGYYTLTLDLSNNTIKILRTELYIVGDATPIGWNIDQAIALTEDAVNGCIFTYSGPMVAGQFKFPVNRNTDWGQDMYMMASDSTMYRHVGGASDDNKWTISTAGNYVITANIETLKISIQKQ